MRHWKSDFSSYQLNKFGFVMPLKILFISALIWAFQAQTWANTERRVALVIGNASYSKLPLKNPVNDATDIAESLRGVGFKVIERYDITTKQIGATLREFKSVIRPGDVVLFYYAGHGLQIRGENYLPAVDADIDSEEDVPLHSLSTKQILDILAESKSSMNMVFLDACRDNPFASKFRTLSRGLSRENAPTGTLISFATRPGSVASDGSGRNGLYTSVLLQQFNEKNQPIEVLLKRVTSTVKQLSQGKQEPWMEGSIEGDFCFGICATSSASTTPPNMPINSTGSGLDVIQDLLGKTKMAYAAGKADDMIAYSNAILAINPNETTALTNLAAAYVFKSDLQKSEWFLKKALDINPNLGIAYNNRAAIAEIKGNTKAALADYRLGCQYNSTLSCKNFARLSSSR